MGKNAERVYTTSTGGVARRRIVDVAQEHPKVIRKPKVKKGAAPKVRRPRKLDYHHEPPELMRPEITRIVAEGVYTKVEYRDESTWIIR